jgi:hypothetical protein
MRGMSVRCFTLKRVTERTRTSPSWAHVGGSPKLHSEHVSSSAMARSAVNSIRVFALCTVAAAFSVIAEYRI